MIACSAAKAARRSMSCWGVPGCIRNQRITCLRAARRRARVTAGRLSRGHGPFECCNMTLREVMQAPQVRHFQACSIMMRRIVPSLRLRTRGQRNVSMPGTCCLMACTAKRWSVRMRMDAAWVLRHLGPELGMSVCAFHASLVISCWCIADQCSRRSRAPRKGRLLRRLRNLEVRKIYF